MSKIKIITLFFVGAILFTILAIQPLNSICRATQKCHPIILSYYLPKKIGTKQYKIYFAANSEISNIDFIAKDNQKTILAGEDSYAVYTIKNLTDQDIKIRPKLSLNPETASDYIKFYECLCSQEYKIKKGESVELLVRLQLKLAIENSNLFQDGKPIEINYNIFAE